MVSPRPAFSPRQQGYSSRAASGQRGAQHGAQSPASPSDALERPDRPPLRPPWIVVARLIRTHGRHGELIAEILTDFPEKFHERRRLLLIPPERLRSRPREMELENFWFLRSRLVVKFRCVDSIKEAEALRGFDVAIPAADRAALEAGAVYVSDLIGCRVIDLNRDSADVGEVVDLDRASSSTELLVVRPRDRRPRSAPDANLLIPFVKEYVIRIDLPNRTIEMRLPNGLLDINAPLTEEEKREMNRPEKSRS